jgi:hypothetical protein
MSTDTDAWTKWARDQREQHEQWLALAESGKFRTSEIDASGQWKDSTQGHIARLKAAIASLDKLMSN